MTLKTFIYYEKGDLTEVRAIRERLQCKSFEWYMKEIGTVFVFWLFVYSLLNINTYKAYDIPKYWPLTQPEMIAQGKLKNLGTSHCVSSRNGIQNGDPVVMTQDCQPDGYTKGFLFTLSWHEDIGKNVSRFTYSM